MLLAKNPPALRKEVLAFLQPPKAALFLSWACFDCSAYGAPELSRHSRWTVMSPLQFLKSPSAVKMMNRFSLKDHLEEGLAAPNPVIRELCLKGLSSFVFQQEKVRRSLARSLAGDPTGNLPRPALVGDREPAFVASDGLTLGESAGRTAWLLGVGELHLFPGKEQ